MSEGKIKKLISIFTMTAITNIAIADCTQNSCAGVYVDKLYVKSSGIVYIGTSGDENLLDCNAVSGVYTTVSLEDPGANAIYSTLLSAQMANKKVQVRIVNDSAMCDVAYITLDRQ